MTPQPLLVFTMPLAPYSKYRVQVRVYENRSQMQRGHGHDFPRLKFEDARQRGVKAKMMMDAVCTNLRKRSNAPALWRRRVRAVVTVHRDPLSAGTLAHEFVHAAVHMCPARRQTAAFQEDVATAVGRWVTSAIQCCEDSLKLSVLP